MSTFKVHPRPVAAVSPALRPASIRAAAVPQGESFADALLIALGRFFCGLAVLAVAGLFVLLIVTGLTPLLFLTLGIFLPVLLPYACILVAMLITNDCEARHKETNE